MGTKYNGGDVKPTATLEDCNKLWSSIKKELMSDASIVVYFATYPDSQIRPCIRVESSKLIDDLGTEQQYIWATYEFPLGAIAITIDAFHKLLVRAYTNMDAWLRGQAAF